MKLSLPHPVLMLVTEPMEPTRLTEIVREAASGGANMVHLRDKTLSSSELIRVARDLKPVLHDALLVVNGCPFAAKEADSRGVHLPESGIRTAQARQIVGPDSLIGRSVHSIASALDAEREGANYVVAGTIFASRSHPGGHTAGLDFLREVCLSVSIPVIAIGGIIPDNACACMKAGAAGIAVLSAIMHVEDPRIAAERFCACLAEC